MAEEIKFCDRAEAATAQQIQDIENETRNFIPDNQPLDSKNQTVVNNNIHLKKSVMHENQNQTEAAQTDSKVPEEAKSYIDRFLSDTQETPASQQLGKLHCSQVNGEMHDFMLSRCKRLGYIEDNGIPSDSMLCELEGILIPSQIRPRLCAQYLVSELQKQGYKFGYTSINREINHDHVSRLRKHIETNDEKCFHQAAKVCKATDMLVSNTLYDFKGNALTKETADIDKYLILLDGQHRLACRIENPDIDLYVEFVDGTNAIRYITDLNNYSTTWNRSACVHAVADQHPEALPLLTSIKRFKERYKVSDKFAEMALTHAVDKYKRETLLKMSEHTENIEGKFILDPFNEKLADSIMSALFAQFNGNSTCRRIEMISSLIDVYKSMNPDEKLFAVRDMKEFIMLLDSNFINKILDLIDKKNTGDLKPTWQNGWLNFRDNHLQEDRAALEPEIDAIIQKWWANNTEESTNNKPKSRKTFDFVYGKKMLGRKKSKNAKA